MILKLVIRNQLPRDTRKPVILIKAPVEYGEIHQQKKTNISKITAPLLLKLGGSIDHMYTKAQNFLAPTLKCPHGIQRKLKGTGKKSRQVVNFCDCKVQVNVRQNKTGDVDANTSEDLATVDVDANTLEEPVLFLESETESDLGVDIALPNPDSCDISVMMFRDHVPSKGRKRTRTSHARHVP